MRLHQKLCSSCTLLHMMILKRHRVRKEVSHLMRFLEGPQPKGPGIPQSLQGQGERNAQCRAYWEATSRAVSAHGSWAKRFPKKTVHGTWKAAENWAKLFDLVWPWFSYLIGFAYMGFSWVSRGFHMGFILGHRDFLCPCHDQGRGGSVLAGRGSSLHGSRGATKGHEGKERQEGQLGPTTGPMGAFWKRKIDLRL